MQSVAAYYVLVASDVANQASREARFQHAVPARRSRLAAFVATLRRPARRAVAAAV